MRLDADGILEADDEVDAVVQPVSFNAALNKVLCTKYLCLLAMHLYKHRFGKIFGNQE